MKTRWLQHGRDLVSLVSHDREPAPKADRSDTPDTSVFGSARESADGIVLLPVGEDKHAVSAGFRQLHQVGSGVD
jgi:hypothetical protein